jgi:N-dimethylarginine dimethylaminohydrolase
MSRFNEFDPLTRVLLYPPRAAFGNAARIDAEWRALNFTAPPDLSRANAEFEIFAALVQEGGADVVHLREGPGLTLDAVYVHDASIVTPRGGVLCRMGKAARSHEPAAHGHTLPTLGVSVLGAIEPPGLLEGGDVLWFDERTVVVGRGYRTNDAGIQQFRRLLGGETDVIVVPLPHYRGPGDVFHLMSIVSPVDRDLAVVYSQLMPVTFREWLQERGLTLVEVPDSEFESMGANVLALGPRRVVMLEGNPITRARLEAAGAEVLTYAGNEISIKGGGGPTCLTRPLARADR